MIVASPTAAHVVRIGRMPVKRGRMRPMARASSAMPMKVTSPRESAEAGAEAGAALQWSRKKKISADQLADAVLPTVHTALAAGE